MDNGYNGLIYTANTLHIMRWQAVEAVFAGLSLVAYQQALLIIYGPFKYRGEFISASNQAFDNIIRQRNVGSAIRDFEKADELASKASFVLQQDVAMPANNQCLIWQQNNY